MFHDVYIYICSYIVMSITTLLFAKFWELLLCRRGALKRSPSTNLAVWTPSGPIIPADSDGETKTSCNFKIARWLGSLGFLCFP